MQVKAQGQDHPKALVNTPLLHIRCTPGAVQLLNRCTCLSRVVMLRTGGLVCGRDGLVAVLGRGGGDAGRIAAVLLNMPALACMHEGRPVHAC